MRGGHSRWHGPARSGPQVYTEFKGGPLPQRHMPVYLTAPSADSRAENEVRAGPCSATSWQ